ncbi:GNAT family N-acetyltransferase [Cyclobacterium sediminis]
MKSSALHFSERLSNEFIPYPLLLLADETKEAINNYIHQCEIYLIKNKNQVVGVCAIQEIDTYTIEIKNLAIIKEHRNCGIGSWCIQKVKEIYPAKIVLVGTGDASSSSLRFYKKNGFKPHAIRKDFFLNNYDHPIIENGRQLIDQIVLKNESAKY